MAKKKASKAMKKKSSPKASKKKARIPSASRRVSRSPKSKQSAGTVEVVKPPMVDVTPEIKKDVVEVKPEAPKTEAPKVEPVEKHEEFAQALTEEPPKRGFFSRLFGRK